MVGYCFNKLIIFLIVFFQLNSFIFCNSSIENSISINESNHYNVNEEDDGKETISNNNINLSNLEDQSFKADSNKINSQKTSNQDVEAINMSIVNNENTEDLLDENSRDKVDDMPISDTVDMISLMSECDENDHKKISNQKILESNYDIFDENNDLDNQKNLISENKADIHQNIISYKVDNNDIFQDIDDDSEVDDSEENYYDDSEQDTIESFDSFTIDESKDRSVSTMNNGINEEASLNNKEQKIIQNNNEIINEKISEDQIQNPSSENIKNIDNQEVKAEEQIDGDNDSDLLNEEEDSQDYDFVDDFDEDEVSY